MLRVRIGRQSMQICRNHNAKCQHHLCCKPCKGDCDLPCDERVEGKVGDECAVGELDDSRQHQEHQEGVDQLETFWCVVHVGVV